MQPYIPSCVNALQKHSLLKLSSISTKQVKADVCCKTLLCLCVTFYSASAHHTDFFVYLILLLESFIMKVETHFGSVRSLPLSGLSVSIMCPVMLLVNIHLSVVPQCCTLLQKLSRYRQCWMVPVAIDANGQGLSLLCKHSTGKLFFLPPTSIPH